jgi:hypothetical protein
VSGKTSIIKYHDVLTEKMERGGSGLAGAWIGEKVEKLLVSRNFECQDEFWADEYECKWAY